MPAPHLYGSSKKEALVDAVAAVYGGMTIRQASEEFDVRKSTLHDRVKNLHAKEPGRPCELDGATEKTLAELVAEWGYSLVVRRANLHERVFAGVPPRSAAAGRNEGAVG